MQLTTTLATLLTASGLVDAYQVRIGYKRSTSASGPNAISWPFFKVWDDNWSYKAEKEFPNQQGPTPSKTTGFCARNGCPFQVDGIIIGIRVREDGGSDGAIRVEAWQGSKATWTWCKKVDLTENNEKTWFGWECNFAGL
ncbi:hypothetical protein OQA88_13431 [Cercophora sp. LCS_1]